MKLLPMLCTVAALAAAPVFARDTIQIAGSSTVLPYASIVAEAFGENFEFPTPVVQSGGSSAGLKQFCEGVGENTIDIANASRPIKDKEIAACAENGVTDIVEVRIGYDGIVFASLINGPDFALTPEDIYVALNANSTVETWDQVRPDLPNQQVMMFVPGTKHGTREVFEEKVLAVGCEQAEGIAEMTKELLASCIEVRTDGRAVDIDGDYTETLARIRGTSDAIGVFGLSFYLNNASEIKVATIDNVVPSTETIASGEYPISRPLYFYLKAAHVGTIPGLQEYAAFFVADYMAGPNGPLAYYGLVADPELAATQAAVSALETMK